MPLRLERICGKKCEQRVDPLVQSAATPPPPVRRELNDVWSLYGARRARLSWLGERRQEAGIRVHRPPPSIGVTAAPLSRVSQRETLIGVKIFGLSMISNSSLSRSSRLCRDISMGSWNFTSGEIPDAAGRRAAGCAVRQAIRIGGGQLPAGNWARRPPRRTPAIDSAAPRRPRTAVKSLI
jgi:hypothetical protein